MANERRPHTIRVSVTLYCAMFVAGCDVAANPALAVDWSAASTRWVSFVQQYAREALAAFLF